MNKKKIKTILATIPLCISALLVVVSLIHLTVTVFVYNYTEILNFFINNGSDILVTIGMIAFIIWFWWGLYYLNEIVG